jgi:hypothetical protein
VGVISRVLPPEERDHDIMVTVAGVFSDMVGTFVVPNGYGENVVGEASRKIIYFSRPTVLDLVRVIVHVRAEAEHFADLFSGDVPKGSRAVGSDMRNGSNIHF